MEDAWLLAEQSHELWAGDAAQIRAGVVRKQKTDRRGASHILQLPVDLPPDRRHCPLKSLMRFV